ncbi:MAG: SEL1-like repeat protein [Succinivibrio sp.]|nr:SEL1-like repeat protein [Succinivibrio sp.]
MAENSIIDANSTPAKLVIPKSDDDGIFGKGIDIGANGVGLKVDIFDSKETHKLVAHFDVFDNTDTSKFAYKAIYKNYERSTLITLPVDVNNLLASKANSCGDTFYAEVIAVDLNTNEVLGNKAYLELHIDGMLNRIESATAAPEYVEFGTNQTLQKVQDTPLVSDTPAVQEVKSETVQATATTTDAPQKKSRLWLIIAAAIAGLILLLLAIFAALYFTGALKSLFGGDKVPQAQEQTIEESQSEPQESASDESASDNATDNTATDEDNSSSQQESVAEDNTQVNTPVASQDDDEEVVVVTKKKPSSSSSQTSACSLASSSDDLALIKGCLATKPQAEVVKSLVEESFANNRCNVGKRLLSSYGRRDAQFAYMYGQYFDANSSLTTTCETKDQDKAIYWYEKAVELGDTTNAKAALDKLK